jgi:hypothetical protein
MGRSDEFLGVRPLAVLKPRRKRIRKLHVPAADFHSAFSGIDGPFPYRPAFPDDHKTPPWNILKNYTLMHGQLNGFVGDFIDFL